MKRYGQFCALARALDVVGERWSLLIVRELAVSPRRYGELRTGLHGIATNLLADRLRQLEGAGVVHRSGDLYGLTERGTELEPVLAALARWGIPLMAAGQGDDAFRTDWLVLALPLVLEGARSPSPLVVEVRVDGESVTVAVGPDGAVVAWGAPPGRADVVLDGGAEDVLDLLAGGPTDDVVVDGTKPAVARLHRIVRSGMGGRPDESRTNAVRLK